MIRAFRLLMAAVCIAVFFPAQRACDVMDDCRDLQSILRTEIRPFYLLSLLFPFGCLLM